MSRFVPISEVMADVANAGQIPFRYLVHPFALNGWHFKGHANKSVKEMKLEHDGLSPVERSSTVRRNPKGILTNLRLWSRNLEWENIWSLNSYLRQHKDSLVKTNKQNTKLQTLVFLLVRNSWARSCTNSRSSLFQPQVSPETPCVCSQRLREPLHEEDPVVTPHVEAGQLLLQPTPTVCHSLAAAAAAPTLLLSCLGQTQCYDAGPGGRLANRCMSAKHSEPQ